MLKHQLSFGASVAVLLALSAGSSTAHQASPTPIPQPTVVCGGQYECVEDRPMTPAEAQVSRGHPQNGEPQDPKQVAAAQPNAREPSADEKREGTSAP